MSAQDRLNDIMSEALAVSSELVEEGLVQTDVEASKLTSKLQEYNRAQDVYQDFSAEAAKQLVYESKFSKYATDRIRASREILDRAFGKPINRQISLTTQSTDMTLHDLRARTERLMIELGYKEGVSGDRLILEEGESAREQGGAAGADTAGEAVPIADGREGDKGQDEA